MRSHQSHWYTQAAGKIAMAVKFPQCSFLQRKMQIAVCFPSTPETARCLDAALPCLAFRLCFKLCHTIVFAAVMVFISGVAGQWSTLLHDALKHLPCSVCVHMGTHHSLVSWPGRWLEGQQLARPGSGPGGTRRGERTEGLQEP